MRPHTGVRTTDFPTNLFLANPVDQEQQDLLFSRTQSISTRQDLNSCIQPIPESVRRWAQESAFLHSFSCLRLTLIYLAPLHNSSPHSEESLAEAKRDSFQSMKN